MLVTYRICNLPSFYLLFGYPLPHTHSEYHMCMFPKERERLHAMMAHLRMTKEADIKNPSSLPQPPKSIVGLALSPGPPMINNREKVRLQEKLDIVTLLVRQYPNSCITF